jgi:hypothetical protein
MIKNGKSDVLINRGVLFFRIPPGGVSHSEQKNSTFKPLIPKDTKTGDPESTLKEPFFYLFDVSEICLSGDI